MKGRTIFLTLLSAVIHLFTMGQTIQLPTGTLVEIQFVEKAIAFEIGVWENQDFRINQFHSVDIWICDDGRVWEQYDQKDRGHLYPSIEGFKKTRGNGLHWLSNSDTDKPQSYSFHISLKDIEKMIAEKSHQEMKTGLDESFKAIHFENGQVVYYSNHFDTGTLFRSLEDFQFYVEEYLGTDFIVAFPGVKRAKN